MKLTVIIVTLNRPDCVHKCLDCLRSQSSSIDEIIVVDASADSLTREVVQNFAGTQYLRNDAGFGRMTASRNIGLKASRGDIIAFLDDDAFAEPDWAAEIKRTYSEPDVGAAGGRALNRQPAEDKVGVSLIGQLSDSGALTGFFAADPGRTIEVDHVMGCNMSFRRDVIVQLGGFREDYPGISGVREDTDMCLRVRRLGYRILFNPAAIVEHVGAPQAVGKRFDWRYTFYGQRNHILMLARNYGPGAAVLRRFLVGSALDTARTTARRVGGALVWVAATFAGTLAGLWSAIRVVGAYGNDPIRHDRDAEELRRDMLRPRGDAKPSDHDEHVESARGEIKAADLS